MQKIIRLQSTSMFLTLLETMKLDKVEFEADQIQKLKRSFEKTHQEIIEKEKKCSKYVLRDNVDYKRMRKFYNKSKIAFANLIKQK